jgi:NADPH:quinone reductase
MTVDLPGEALELRSLVTSAGILELSLHDVPVPTPAPNEVLVRIEASPINPSDLGLLVAGADMTHATVTGTPDRPVVTAPLAEGAVKTMTARLDKPLPVGNEGAGTVVAAGSSDAAQALLGKTVGIAGGAMYSQYRAVDARACLVLPDGASAKDGASSFVNPLTALGMTETMRREGHSALVHTAAASNLGQMLVKLCQKDGIPLVNIVRKPEQEELLRSLGAAHVLNSTSPSFSADLVEALKATSATLAFDATGGGTLASQILKAWRRRPTRGRGSTHATGRACTSRCTSTARWTPAQRSSTGTSAWHGASGDGCSPHFFRAPGPRPSAGCAPAWPTNSPRPSQAVTPAKCHCPECSNRTPSTSTSGGQRGRNSS